ncbi:rhomboid family intramembrane serine protease [Labrys neptuniae]
MSLKSRGNLDPPAAFNVPAVVLLLTGLIVAVHIVRAVVPVGWDAWLVRVFAFTPLRYDPALAGSTTWPGGYAADIAGFLTCFFVQYDPGTLMINGAALLILGSAVAWRFGTWRFLAFTGLCTIIGSLACLLVYWGNGVAMVGAGGGLSGLFAASIHFLFKGGSAMSAFRVAGGGAFRKPAWTLRDALADQNVRIWLAVFAFITAWNALSPFILTASQGVPSWPANIGGFLAGLFLFRFFDRQPRLRRVV